MNRLEFYKEMYFKELERKETVNTRLQWAISIWVLLIGALLFCLNNFHKVINGLEIVFLILLGISFILISVATIFLATYLWGKTFGYIPSAKEFEDRYTTIYEHYTKYPDYTYLIDQTFEKESIDILVECTTEFRKINNDSLKKLLKSMQSLLVAALFLFWGFLILIPDFLKKEEPINKVEIININSIEDINDKINIIDEK